MEPIKLEGTYTLVFTADQVAGILDLIASNLPMKTGLPFFQHIEAQVRLKNEQSNASRSNPPTVGSVGNSGDGSVSNSRMGSNSPSQQMECPD